jgi:cysteinyl-tRNA synthetase
MIELIKRIEKNGFTYFAGGNLYFDISKFPTYGDLALLRMDEQKSGFERVEQDENKRNSGDFVLWFTKSKFENQALVWDSPWGRGYPGWHIECSAMSMKYLGENFDIHAGGIDHIPIHHTNEIAQSESAIYGGTIHGDATGKKPWVSYWLHNEFLVMDKGKMSKSAGGFLTLQSLIDEGFDPLDYRYFLLSGHYRSQLQFSFESLKGARNSRKSLLDKVCTLADKAGYDGTQNLTDFQELEEDSKYMEAFKKAIEDDLSTPRALAELWGLLKDGKAALQTLTAVFNMDKVLGLGLEEAVNKRNDSKHGENDEFSLEIKELIEKRTEAKKAKDFATADNIRQSLKERGIILEDGPAGTTWRSV